MIKEKKFLDSVETENSIKKILNYNILDDNAKKILTKNIAEKLDWFELKPNIFGVSVNLNKIIKDAVKDFKKKIKEG